MTQAQTIGSPSKGETMSESVKQDYKKHNFGFMTQNDMTTSSQFSELGFSGTGGVTVGSKLNHSGRSPPYPPSYQKFKQAYKSSIHTNTAAKNTMESMDAYLATEIPGNVSHTRHPSTTQHAIGLRNSLFVDTEMTINDLAPPSGLSITQSIRKPRVRSALNRNQP